MLEGQERLQPSAQGQLPLRIARASGAPGREVPRDGRRDPDDEGADVDGGEQLVDGRPYLKLARSCWTVAASGAVGASFRNVSKSPTILSGCFLL